MAEAAFRVAEADPDTLLGTPPSEEAEEAKPSRPTRKKWRFVNNRDPWKTLVFEDGDTLCFGNGNPEYITSDEALAMKIIAVADKNKISVEEVNL